MAEADIAQGTASLPSPLEVGVSAYFGRGADGEWVRTADARTRWERRTPIPETRFFTVMNENVENLAAFGSEEAVAYVAANGLGVYDLLEVWNSFQHDQLVLDLVLANTSENLRFQIEVDK